MTRSEAQVLKERYGIQASIDLRSRKERDSQSSTDILAEVGILPTHCPIEGYPDDAIALATPTADHYVNYYLSMVENARHAFRAAVEQIDSLVGYPQIVFCHAGKDRTGVLAAILLDRAGLPASDIAEDYRLSGDFIVARLDRFEEKWRARNLSRAEYAVRMRTDACVMLRFLEAMKRFKGGLANYICGTP